MKRIILLFVFTFCAITTVTSQDIKVVEKQQEKTTVIFETTNGSQIPLFEPLGSSNYTAGNTMFIIKQLRSIGSAPLTLEFNPGFYDLQMYKDSIFNKFEIQADGGTQKWMLKPKWKGNNVFGFISGFGIIGTIASGMFLAMDYRVYGSDSSSGLYDPNYDYTPKIILTSAVGGVTVISVILWILGLPNAKRIE